MLFLHLSNLLLSNQATRQRGMPGCPRLLASPGRGQASPGLARPGVARPGLAWAASCPVASHARLRPVCGFIGDARLKASKVCPVEGARLTPGC